MPTRLKLKHTKAGPRSLYRKIFASEVRSGDLSSRQLLLCRRCCYKRASSPMDWLLNKYIIRVHVNDSSTIWKRRANNATLARIALRLHLEEEGESWESSLKPVVIALVLYWTKGGLKSKHQSLHNSAFDSFEIICQVWSVFVHS